MRKFITFIFILYSIAVFSQSTNNNKIFRINPDYAQGAVVDKIYETVKYIPLETTAESLFGAIYQLEVTDQYFIILDRNTNSILLFNKNGQFHTKIKGGDQSFLGNVIHSFNVIKGKKQIMFRHRRTLHYYNFDGKELPNPSTLALPNSLKRYWFNDSTNVDFDYNIYEKLPDSTAFKLNFYANRNLIKSAFPYNPKHSPFRNDDIYYESHSVFYKTTNDTTAIFCQPYDYSVYLLSSNGRLSKKVTFLFPLANSLPDNFNQDTLLRGRRITYLRNHKDKFYGISYFYQFGNNYVFKLDHMSYPDTYVYNTQSKNLYCIQRISPDSSNYYLPVSDILGFVDFANSNFLTRDNKYLYTSVSSLQMFKAKSVTTDKHPKYPVALKKYFATQSRKSNPVIIQVKLKENL